VAPLRAVGQRDEVGIVEEDRSRQSDAQRVDDRLKRLFPRG
jgi:hypothetical protein